jgi:hypothetical protein
MQRAVRRTTPWQDFLLGARDLLRLDLFVGSMTARHAGPTAQKVLLAPALTMLWLVERMLPARLR